MPGVYAVLDNTYKRGDSNDWSSCVYIDGTQDLHAALSAHMANEGPDSVSHVRVMSFSMRDEEKMVAQAREWVGLADGAGAKLVRDKWSQRIVSAKPSFFYFCDFVDENDEVVEDECEIFYMSHKEENDEEVVGQVLDFGEVNEEIKARAAAAKEKLAAGAKKAKEAAEARKIKKEDEVQGSDAKNEKSEPEKQAGSVKVAEKFKEEDVMGSEQMSVKEGQNPEEQRPIMESETVRSLADLKAKAAEEARKLRNIRSEKKGFGKNAKEIKLEKRQKKVDRKLEGARLVEQAKQEETRRFEQERSAKEAEEANAVAVRERLLQARIALKTRNSEKARLVKEFEDAKLAEYRLAKDVEEARLQKEQKLEEARLAEQERLKEEARLAEEARLEEARLKEEARLAEEARL
eukprot:CAMPEP_0116011938 /NCGR_PEP_ID=MMETSP0321-20121206/4844_1 /TAXON_ID=163516 /ORGANISM="Leptocylindrus danicus var. danicus, Strain B650" /LENGTH=405 /DNA_ID=CAMNT_0003481223 /DNA_START=242 /DNA_END=1455 /DNA_ORIENTATION=+